MTSQLGERLQRRHWRAPRLKRQFGDDQFLSRVAIFTFLFPRIQRGKVTFVLKLISKRPFRLRSLAGPMKIEPSISRSAVLAPVSVSGGAPSIFQIRPAGTASWPMLEVSVTALADGPLRLVRCAGRTQADAPCVTITHRFTSGISSRRCAHSIAAGERSAGCDPDGGWWLRAVASRTDLSEKLGGLFRRAARAGRRAGVGGSGVGQGIWPPVGHLP